MRQANYDRTLAVVNDIRTLIGDVCRLRLDTPKFLALWLMSSVSKSECELKASFETKSELPTERIHYLYDSAREMRDELEKVQERINRIVDRLDKATDNLLERYEELERFESDNVADDDNVNVLSMTARGVQYAEETR